MTTPAQPPDEEVIKGLIEISKEGKLLPICRHCNYAIKLNELLWQDPKHYKEPERSDG